MFKRSPRYILMIVIMAVGMMMSSMGTFASHGTNGLTGYEMNLGAVWISKIIVR
ncbi:TPA: hypothetical protein ACH9V4_004459 [Escherichia coli]